MKPLSKPGPSFAFWLSNVYFDLNYARTWTWGEDTKSGDRKIHWLEVSTTNKEAKDISYCCLTVIIVTIKVMVGWKCKCKCKQKEGRN